MKRAAVLVSALALIAFTVSLGAQAKTNFAGKWTVVPADPSAAPAAPPAGAPGGGGGGGGRGGGRGGGAVSGMEVTLTQDATTLTIDKVQGGRGGAPGTPVKLTVKLDGTDSKNTVTIGGNPVDQTLKATWDGAKLTITTSFDMGRGPQTSTQVLAIDGGNLVVTNKAADGTETKVTYKKS